MPSVEEFAAAPSHEALDQCSKDQLLKIAEHYELQISSSFAKDKVKAIVRSNLAESGVLHSVLPKLQVDAVDFVFRYWRPGGKVMVGWGSFYRTGQY